MAGVQMRSLDRSRPRGCSTDRQRAEFERLYRESYPAVYNYVSYRMAASPAAEDVVSEAFLRAARAFDGFDPARAKFTTWVMSIALNCMRTHFRRQRPEATLDNVPEGVLQVDGGQDGVDDRELAAQLLSMLDDEEREMVYRKYYEGKRNIEIAEEMKMNPSTVATKLQRALGKMRAAGGSW